MAEYLMPRGVEKVCISATPRDTSLICGLVDVLVDQLCSAWKSYPNGNVQNRTQRIAKSLPREAGHRNVRISEIISPLIRSHWLLFYSVINLPYLVKIFFGLIKPFIDPVTATKLSFDNDASKLAPKAQLEDSFGGDVHFPAYNHAEYWEESGGMIAYALERKRKAFEMWQQLGGRIGIREWDYKEHEAEW